jgi:hypothetical protein
MDGTWQNYRNHAALAAGVTLICAFFGGPFWGAVVASMYFWGKEIGEKCVRRPAPRLPWSDMNPFDDRWSWDSRFDLLSALVGAWVTAIIWHLV